MFCRRHDLRFPFVVVLWLLLSMPALSQQLSLPSIDGITFFYRAGRMARSSVLNASPTAPCADRLSGLPMCGWGFETVYVMTKTKATPENTGQGTAPAQERTSPWEAELAVGYDFLTLRATTGQSGSYQVFGSVQTLPSITLYVSRDISSRGAIYAGLGTGIVVLKNVRAYDSIGRVYQIAGDTWGLTPSIGMMYTFHPATQQRAGASVFAELSYEVRDFPSIAYTLPSDVKTLPADLPRNLSAKGPVLNFGIQLDFRKKPETPAPPK